MKTEIKFAIVGCGQIAGRHALHIHNHARLAAVCDIKKERAVALGDKYDARVFENMDDMLLAEVDLDVVSICTPNHLHAEQTIKALRAGKHVICEKPMAIATEDCRRMIAEMESSGKILFIVKQNRFNPPLIALKEALASGKLGKIVNVQVNCFWNRNADYYRNSDWKGKIDRDGGILFTQFSHFIDLLYWLVGDVERAYCLSNNFLHKDIIDFEDTGVVILGFSTGALGTLNFTINSFQKNYEGSITVFGERGTVKVGGQYLNVLEYQCIEGQEINNIPPSCPPNDYGFYKGSMSNHGKVYENVIGVLQGSAPIATSAYEGLKTVEIIEKIYRSARSLRKKG